MIIKNTTLRGNLLLAPLAGYTDRAFRQIATQWGADCCVTEMVSAEGLKRNGEKTKELLNRFEGEEELITQVFGYAPSQFASSIDTLLTYNPTIIDINCGCPVQKVVKTGAGSALMAKPEIIKEIVNTITRLTSIPVSVKFRLGWNEESINYMDFAKAAVEGGASMLTLHGRTRAQGYAGKANWVELKNLKQNFTDVAVFGSGDVLSAEDAVRMLEETKVDGVMFARGAIGNPFIFKQTKELLETGSYQSISAEERVKTMNEHLALMIHYEGEHRAIIEMRKHIAGYVKGMTGGSRVKQKAMAAKTVSEYQEAFSELFN